MALEFKNMATVDVVETVADEATVLIEEGGVIKRAPKSEVGGKSEWDAVFVVDDVYNISVDTVHLTSGSFDAIKEKVDANDLPKVLIISSYEYGDVCTSYAEPIHLQYNKTANFFTIYYRSSWNNSDIYRFSICPDNTITIDDWA